MKTFIQITAGKGPAECAFVVAKVLKLMIEEIKAEGFTYQVIHRAAGRENGTLQSATLWIEGKTIHSFLQSWLGSICWIGESTFRKHHKRKNWFAGVFQLENSQIKELEERDISYQAMRSRGAGGQHVNKVSSAVRATHKSSGLTVTAMDTRSQHQNKKLARERLEVKWYDAQLEAIKKQAQNAWENHLQLQRGNPVRTFKGLDFKKKKEDKSYKTTRNKLKNELFKTLKK